MTTSTPRVHASWALDVGPAGKDVNVNALPRTHDSIATEVTRGDYVDLARGLASLQEQLNDNLTEWKEALGNEEASDAKKQTPAGDADDVEDDEEVEASDDDDT